MDQKSEPVKIVSSHVITENRSNTSNAKSQEDTLTSHTLVSIGLRRKEWAYSNDDRQWW